MNYWNSLLLKGGAEADVGAGVCNAAGVEIWVLLFSVGAPLTGLFLPPGRRLQPGLKQIRGPAIVLIKS